MCVASDWDTKSSCKTKVSKLELAFTIYKEILWLEIPVEYAVGVTECNTTEKLIKEAF